MFQTRSTGWAHILRQKKKKLKRKKGKRTKGEKIGIKIIFVFKNMCKGLFLFKIREKLSAF